MTAFPPPKETPTFSYSDKGDATHLSGRVWMAKISPWKPSQAHSSLLCIFRELETFFGETSLTSTKNLETNSVSSPPHLDPFIADTSLEHANNK